MFFLSGFFVLQKMHVFVCGLFYALIYLTFLKYNTIHEKIFFFFFFSISLVVVDLTFYQTKFVSFLLQPGFIPNIFELKKKTKKKKCIKNNTNPRININTKTIRTLALYYGDILVSSINIKIRFDKIVIVL